MAITSRPTRADFSDPAASGPIFVDVHYELTTDNAEAILMGAQRRSVVVRMEIENRAGVLGDLATAIGRGLVVADGGWPEAALPLPRPRKP